MLNRYDDADPLHRANRAWLRDTDRMTVCVSIDELAEAVAPSDPGGLTVAAPSVGNLAERYHFDVERCLGT